MKPYLWLLIYAKANKITIIIMTHKMDILQKVDKVMVVKDGNVVSMGLREDILK